MTFRTHPIFDKMYAKLRVGEKRRFKERRDLFLSNPFHPLLRTHPLHGEFEGFWSINVGGDLRAVYKYDTADSVVFTKLGTHHELFGS
jgi:addiction module RelE/StbE family toxin